MYYDYADLQRRLDEMPVVTSHRTIKVGGVSETSTPEEDAIYKEVWVESFLDHLTIVSQWMRAEGILGPKETFLSQLKASARVLPFQTSAHFTLSTWEKLFKHAPDTFERLYRDRRPAQKRRP